jgi:hypothetical protein
MTYYIVGLGVGIITMPKIVAILLLLAAVVVCAIELEFVTPAFKIC